MNHERILTGIPTSKLRPHRRNYCRRSRCIYLEFMHPRARSVCVAGSFNDWRPAVTPMIPMGRGWWVKGLVLPPGRYEYRLVVDGQWVPDPNAAEAAPTPDGRVNSVLVVPAEPVVAKPKPAALFPVEENKALRPLPVKPAGSKLLAHCKNDSFSRSGRASAERKG